VICLSSFETVASKPWIVALENVQSVSAALRFKVIDTPEIFYSCMLESVTLIKVKPSNLARFVMVLGMLTIVCGLILSSATLS
jgi:hypothetical protein